MFIVFAILLSCAAQAKIMSGVFATCAKADLGGLVTGADGKQAPLEAAVAAIIEADGAALEVTLAAIAAVVGIDAIDCAIAAVEAAFPATSTLPAAGSGSAGSAAPAPATRLARDVGLARAHQFVTDWRAGKKPAASK